MPPVISAIQKLPALSADLFPAGLDFAIVESAAEILFLDLASGPAADYKSFPRGLVFGKDAEIRWVRRASGLLHAVRIDDLGRSLPGAEHTSPLIPLEDDNLPDRILLLGQRESDGAFREGRIPRALNYPFSWRFPKAMRLAVGLRHYRFQDGSRELYRCASILADPGPEATHE